METSPKAAQPDGQLGRGTFALGSLALILGIALAYGSILRLGLLGWDTYPMLLTSRVASVADLVGSFSEELMDGRYVDGHLYRPVANLTLALDHATWGLEPFGYHLGDLVCFALAAFALLGLGCRWLGRSVGAWWAAMLFALHPLQLEVLPVAARRADTLSLLFIVLGLWAWPLYGRWRFEGRIWAVGALVLLAVGSRESGALLLPLLFAARTLAGEERGLGERAKAAALQCALPFVAIVVYMAARFAVLGSLGGHENSSLAAGVTGLGRVLTTYGAALLTPQPIGRWPTFVTLATTALAMLLLASLVRASVGPAAAAWPPGPARSVWSARSLIAFLALWQLGIGALSAMSGSWQSWYGAHFLPAFALLCGLLIDSALAELRGDERRRAWLWLGAALLIALAPLRYTPLLHRYSGWEEMDRRLISHLERFDGVVASAAPGDVHRIGMPPSMNRSRPGVRVDGVSGISDYGLQAYAELHHPGRGVRVVRRSALPDLVPSEEAITIVLMPRPIR